MSPAARRPAPDYERIHKSQNEIGYLSISILADR
jgi:hypothetical protein